MRDENGKPHFPNHAEASTHVYASFDPDDQQTIDLIGKDMLCHTVKPAQAESLLLDKDFSTLMLTAWAELHANASALFGGFESDSFKIKCKQLLKLCKRYSAEIDNYHK